MSERGAAPEGDALHDLCRADPVWSERYEGWTELGHGGSATVVRTHSKAAGEDIALKVFLRTAAEDWQRFQAEVRNAQGLASPHIVRTYSPFRRGAIAWIEMELVEGADLRQVLYERRLTSGEARDIGAAVARALATAHEAGVVHRDVKPANILLPRSGRPAAKLGDFGTSRLAGADRVTHTGLLTGTPQFVAPEVVAGDSAGPAADVYGLMLCLYLMLSGNRFPFDVAADGPVAQWLKAHTDAPVVPIAAFNPGLPPALAVLVHRGLDKDPARRPTAAEVASTLDELERDGAAEGPARRSKRFGTAAVIAVVGALFALAAVAGIVRSRRGSVSPGGDVAAASPAPAPSPMASGHDAAPLTPRLSSPSPSASSPAGSDSAVPTVLASLHGEVLTLANPGPPLLDVDLVLVDAAGARHRATAPEGIASGEELHLALDDFTPVVTLVSASPSRLEIRSRGVARPVVLLLR